MYRMLIVDDEESICFAMSEYFRMQGFHVDCAQEVEEAEALLVKECYSIVIADLRLTGIFNMGGLEVIKFVHERCPGTRVIVLTAYGSPEMETETRKHGIDAFLHKPQPLPEVAQIVYGLVGSAV